MLKETLKAYTIVGLAIFGVIGLAFAEDQNITNNTTTNSTVNSTNNNYNQNVNQSTSQNTNINTTTIDQTSVSTSSSTSENFNTSNSTINNNSVSDVTSNITQSVSSNVIQKNDSTSLSNNFNNSVSSSSVETKNENINSSVNENKNFNQSNSNSNSRQVVTQRIKGSVSSAISPSINSYSQLVCVSGSSASIQTNLFGIAKGSSIIDENCQRILLSKELAANGLQVASVSLLCQDKRVFKAMEQAGSYCPYKGLIGEEARIGWEQNPQDRPDWEDIKKEYKNLDVKAYKKKDFCRKYKSHKLCLD
tara:strand:+ start:581 stop:1498 length:918 start_codon:yes stop_codon:yes gene_type:complete